MTKVQMNFWLPDDAAKWLRVTAAARGITRSQLVLEMIEEAQREDGR
jgi:hypothetical protein